MYYSIVLHAWHANLGNTLGNVPGQYSQPFSRTFFVFFSAKPHSSVGSVANFRTGGRWFDPIFFPRIDDSHCDRIHSSLTAVCCFYNGYMGKQPVTWKEYCTESMDRCTCCHDITEIQLKTALNTIQPINQSFSPRFWNFESNITSY